VSGSVTGDIIAATKVVLHKTARVSGNIQTGSLVVEDGAEIDGSIKMARAPASRPSRAARRRRRPPAKQP
jgi:cytoskeletal protein CcmA (bactofilin family)